ncbi:MAG: CSLREA domain-containing protein [Lachnospiraceae bacterium]|nr:CSLREA domain-containing protein [Lachnospiraceae bacterium]
MLNGYYAVTFTLSEEDNTEIFLTGLTEKNLESVQTEIINSLVQGRALKIEHLDFIDTEKAFIPNMPDSLLCWAGVTSNIMQYTGWGEAYGLGDCDDMMDMFASNIYNTGGYSRMGVSWLLNGDLFWDVAHEGSKLDAYVINPDAYTPINNVYAFDMVTNVNDYTIKDDPIQNFSEDLQRLRDGYGLCLNVRWLEGSGAHALSLWGYVIDRDYEPTQKEYYVAVILSDSDSDKDCYPDRRMAPNKLDIRWINPYADDQYDSWVLANGSKGSIMSIESLMPYSASLEREENEKATKNKRTTMDLVPLRGIFADDPQVEDVSSKGFTTKQKIYIRPEILNSSGKDYYPDDFTYQVRVTDSDGVEVYNESVEGGPAFCRAHNSYIVNFPAEVGCLEEGVYDVEITINSNQALEEAYYYNNTQVYKEAFEVVEDPLGDASILAEAGTYGKYRATNSLSYIDPEHYLPTEGNIFTLYESYYIDGVWKPWKVAQYATEEEHKEGISHYLKDLTECPDKVNSIKDGTKVRYMLQIQNGDLKTSIYSNEIDLKYILMTLRPSENSTFSTKGDLTPLSVGATALADGEYIGFEIVNQSTNDGSVECNVQLSFQFSDGNKVVFDNDGKSVEIGKGESKEFLISNWPKQYAVNETLGVDAKGTYLLNGEEIVLSRYLGEIRILETPSCQVTTVYDTVNPCDGKISLREALMYAKELGEDTIDIRPFKGENPLRVYTPLVIDSEITILGGKEKEDGTLECAQINYGGTDWNTTAFVIEEGGELNLDGTRLTATSKDKSGFDTNVKAFKNNGGTLNVSRCLIQRFYIRQGGSMIELNGGVSNFKQCAIASNEVSVDAIKISDGATLNMLNCMVSQNEVFSYLIHNDGGKANIVYSTFICNSVDVAEDRTLICSEDGSETNVIGSIVHNNDGEYTTPDPLYRDLGGKINVYGTFYGIAKEDVNFDELSVKGEMKEICATNSGYVEPIFCRDNTGQYYCMLKMQEPAAKQIYLNVKNGKIRLSKDRINWTDTGAEAAFDETDYQQDFFGENHLGFYGCYSPQIVDPDPEPTPDPKPTPEPTPGPKPIDTGDSNHVNLWLIVAILSAVVLLAGGLFLGIRKKKDK